MQYLYQKVRKYRAQKCNLSFVAKSPLRSTGLQTTRFHAAQYRADSTNLKESGATFRHGTVFAPMQCLYQKEAKGMLSPKMQFLFRCKQPTSQYGLAKMRFHAAPYRADRTNLREFGATFLHDTAFAPMQCLYQKVAKGMKSPKM